MHFKLHNTKEKTWRKTMEDGFAVKITMGTEWGNRA
jgi:hypothetical protein